MCNTVVAFVIPAGSHEMQVTLQWMGFPTIYVDNNNINSVYIRIYSCHCREKSRIPASIEVTVTMLWQEFATRIMVCVVRNYDLCSLPEVIVRVVWPKAATVLM